MYPSLSLAAGSTANETGHELKDGGQYEPHSSHCI